MFFSEPDFFPDQRIFFQLNRYFHKFNNFITTIIKLYIKCETKNIVIIILILLMHKILSFLLSAIKTLIRWIISKLNIIIWTITIPNTLSNYRKYGLITPTVKFKLHILERPTLIQLILIKDKNTSYLEESCSDLQNMTA